jgi:hypothetical protein
VGEDDIADRLENLLGDLHAAAEEERKDGEDDDGAPDPHDKESFFKIVMRQNDNFILVVVNLQGFVLW